MLAVLFLCWAFPVKAQDEILTLLKKKADIVIHVVVLDVQGGEENEQGVEEWVALCKVINPIKGLTNKDQKIRFRFNRFNFLGNTEPMIVQKKKDYIVFLKGTYGKVRFPSDEKLEEAYRLVDRWTGALPYHFHLMNRLKEYIK